MRTYNTFLKCTLENLIDFKTEPPSLKILALSTLHLTLSTITYNHSGTYVNFEQTEGQILKLNIPQQLKNQLLSLYKTCPRHFELKSIIKNSDKVITYQIEKESWYFKRLKKKHSNKIFKRLVFAEMKEFLATATKFESNTGHIAKILNNCTLYSKNEFENLVKAKQKIGILKEN